MLIGTKVLTHARYTVFQMAEVSVPRDLFRRILVMIDGLRPVQAARDVETHPSVDWSKLANGRATPEMP